MLIKFFLLEFLNLLIFLINKFLVSLNHIFGYFIVLISFRLKCIFIHNFIKSLLFFGIIFIFSFVKFIKILIIRLFSMSLYLLLNWIILFLLLLRLYLSISTSISCHFHKLFITLPRNSFRFK